jgi:hypothetical protein
MDEAEWISIVTSCQPTIHLLDGCYGHWGSNWKHLVTDLTCSRCTESCQRLTRYYDLLWRLQATGSFHGNKAQSWRISDMDNCKSSISYKLVIHISRTGQVHITNRWNSNRVVTVINSPPWTAGLQHRGQFSSQVSTSCSTGSSMTRSRKCQPLHSE